MPDLAMTNDQAVRIICYLSISFVKILEISGPLNPYEKVYPSELSMINSAHGLFRPYIKYVAC